MAFVGVIEAVTDSPPRAAVKTPLTPSFKQQPAAAAAPPKEMPLHLCESFMNLS